jgi:hypothetical protein
MIGLSVHLPTWATACRTRRLATFSGGMGWSRHPQVSKHDLEGVHRVPHGDFGYGNASRNSSCLARLRCDEFWLSLSNTFTRSGITKEKGTSCCFRAKR